jgi:hypothetical protein
MEDLVGDSGEVTDEVPKGGEVFTVVPVGERRVRSANRSPYVFSIRTADPMRFRQRSTCLSSSSNRVR